MAQIIYQRDIRKRTKEFAIEIIKFTNYVKLQKLDYPLRDQLLRSGTSIGANVIEGTSSSSRKEFIRYYEIALRSANETDYWLDIINSVYHLEEQSKNLLNELQEIRKIIGSIVVKLKSAS